MNNGFGSGRRMMASPHLPVSQGSAAATRHVGFSHRDKAIFDKPGPRMSPQEARQIFQQLAESLRTWRDEFAPAECSADPLQKAHGGTVQQEFNSALVS